jgi:hypothetical protein
VLSGCYANQTPPSGLAIKSPLLDNVGLNSGILTGAVTVAMIAGLSRWVLSTEGHRLPRTRASSIVYDTKRQLRAVGAITACFFAVLPIWLRNDPDWPLLLILTAGGVACLWLTLATIVTDESGITIKFPGYSRSIRWAEIKDVRVNEKTGAIVLFADGKKFSIDYRMFVGTTHLLSEIEARTGLRPASK